MYFSFLFRRRHLVSTDTIYKSVQFFPPKDLQPCRGLGAYGPAVVTFFYILHTYKYAILSYSKFIYARYHFDIWSWVTAAGSTNASILYCIVLFTIDFLYKCFFFLMGWGG